MAKKLERLSKWPMMTRRVPSDSFVLKVVDEDGTVTEYHPHEGEWVEFNKKVRPAQMRLFLDFQGIDVKVLKGMVELWEKSKLLLSQVVHAWTWCGPDGEPYPEPYKRPEAFEDLLDEEVGWLLNTFVEPGTAPKNSPTASSDS